VIGQGLHVVQGFVPVTVPQQKHQHRQQQQLASSSCPSRQEMYHALSHAHAHATISSRTSTTARRAGADIDQETEQQLPLPTTSVDVDNRDPPPPAARGKVNEIDFCIAPADVSLSRSYTSTSPQTTSLTRTLNNASNRAVRRILLARSWPSAEALNRSLRQVLAAESKGSDIDIQQQQQQTSSKCPVPRPILNILVRQGRDKYSPTNEKSTVLEGFKRNRTDQEYVADQLAAFYQRHGTIPGYKMAEAYLECILSLATSGVESSRVHQVMDAGVYDESYRRMVAVLTSVGAVFEPVPGGATDQMRIAPKLVDQDICLSMLDKMNMKREILHVELISSPSTGAKQDLSTDCEKSVVDVKTTNEETTRSDSKVRLKFWKKTDEEVTPPAEQEDSEEDFELDARDLGGVLLSAEEPSMTRQLNVLANIVQRALLFGGDEELLVLSETLDADKSAFVKKWYPSPNGEVKLASSDEEERPGVQFLNCLVLLLKECYKNGVVSTLDPLLPLPKSYANAYERLMASLVELGSGYISPKQNVMTMPIPRTAQEELGRFAVWESTFRSKNTPAYPQDLVGSWQVQDEIGGETIGITTVVFEPEGKVQVALPMQGLRWRLDPGPTHLDTITFQVLGDDGTILQYRGFIDRGARLEARFSKRRVRIRGSVMFQMRYGDGAYMGDGYWKDMLPINYKTGTTKFVMTKN
jgi:hypothetical protein